MPWGLVIALAFGVSLIVYAIYRVERKDEKFTHLPVYISTVCICTLMIYLAGNIPINDITKIVFDVPHQVMSLEMLQEKAYATITDLREVGKLSCKSVAKFATRLGYFGAAFDVIELREYRQELKELLDSLEVPEKDQKEILGILDDKIKQQEKVEREWLK